MNPVLRDHLDLGKPDGPMAPDPKQRPREKNHAIPAGYTFLGQFINHDLQWDKDSKLGEPKTNVEGIENHRTPEFDLDTIYGEGPGSTPEIYDPKVHGKLLVGKSPGDKEAMDLARNEKGKALIGDQRNDENQILSQLHLAFLKFHNAVLEKVRKEMHPKSEQDAKVAFETARNLVRLHYQWIILKEYLPLICGKKVVDELNAKPEDAKRFYPQAPKIPVEFSVAAFRFGHSQLKEEYQINSRYTVALFSRNSIFPDLRGGKPLDDYKEIDWRYFFKIDEDIDPQPSMAITDLISKPLLDVPDGIIKDNKFRSLAQADLQRSLDMGLPSGQEMAKWMRKTPLDDDEIWENAPDFKGNPAPLWYYILREAETRRGGKRLGEVGACIVASVFFGLLLEDEKSILALLDVDPRWAPKPDDFGMKDLLQIAAGKAEFQLPPNLLRKDSHARIHASITA